MLLQRPKAFTSLGLIISVLFVVSVTKKPHIRLNETAKRRPSAFLCGIPALHGQRDFRLRLLPADSVEKSMLSRAIVKFDGKWRIPALAALALVLWQASPVSAADEPDLIFRRSTVFKWVSPNDKLATYGVDDPEIEGVACHFTVPEKGGFKGWLGLAEEVSDISLACRQIGPIRFRDKMGQGDDMFRQRRSLFFKKMQIVRGCDAKRNVLVYMVYSDKLIEGSPKNSTSSVPIMPWGAADAVVQKCGEFVQ